MINNSAVISQLDVTIKPWDDTTDVVISGRVHGHDDKWMIFNITEGFNHLLSYRNKSFNIKFDHNRSTYQLQHYSLEWMMRHGIFKILIHNSLYGVTEQCDSTISDQIVCQNAEMLNIEQQTAVRSIVAADNLPIPFLLFGPPGGNIL